MKRNRKHKSVNQKIKKSANHLGDYLRASRRGNREAEQDLLGPGFHSRNRIHKSQKTYTRKEKHHTTFEEA